mmetsp:Transcript_4354/g.7344  ORF Transcript_4354/g.7344 Transcript_4354/m.7344 type:complete len:460 (+) Transcript_4354:423-1802(+)
MPRRRLRDHAADHLLRARVRLDLRGDRVALHPDECRVRPLERHRGHQGGVEGLADHVGSFVRDHDHLHLPAAMDHEAPALHLPLAHLRAGAARGLLRVDKEGRIPRRIQQLQVCHGPRHRGVGDHRPLRPLRLLPVGQHCPWRFDHGGLRRLCEQEYQSGPDAPDRLHRHHPDHPVVGSLGRVHLQHRRALLRGEHDDRKDQLGPGGDLHVLGLPLRALLDRGLRHRPLSVHHCHHRLHVVLLGRRLRLSRWRRQLRSPDGHQVGLLLPHGQRGFRRLPDRRDHHDQGHLRVLRQEVRVGGRQGQLRVQGRDLLHPLLHLGSRLLHQVHQRERLHPDRPPQLQLLQGRPGVLLPHDQTRWPILLCRRRRLDHDLPRQGRHRRTQHVAHHPPRRAELHPGPAAHRARRPRRNRSLGHRKPILVHIRLLLPRHPALLHRGPRLRRQRQDSRQPQELPGLQR